MTSLHAALVKLWGEADGSVTKYGETEWKPYFDEFCFKKDQRAEVAAGAEWRRTKVFFFLITFFFKEKY